MHRISRRERESRVPAERVCLCAVFERRGTGKQCPSFDPRVLKEIGSKNVRDAERAPLLSYS